MKSFNWVYMLISIVICELAGGIGSIFTSRSVPTWYATLTKSSLNPPSWVFGPVWTTLFVLMGISAYFVWQKGWVRGDVKTALIIFIAQLALNVLWSVIFFGLRSPGWALVEIVVLWLVIAATIGSFYGISKPAAWLLVPYILWVTFASYLNYAVWKLN